jgi:hypothetical protein
MPDDLNAVSCGREQVENVMAFCDRVRTEAALQRYTLDHIEDNLGHLVDTIDAVGHEKVADLPYYEGAFI